jgi:sialic acid synthase SpsE
MQTMQAAFPGIRIGYSDHTVGATAAIAAVALGARVLEKHFTLDNAMPGPDHAFSTNPADMTRYVAAARQAETMLGSWRKEPVGPELNARLSGRRYLTAWGDLPIGTVLSTLSVRSRRVDVSKADTAKLLPPNNEKTVLGWTTIRPLKDGDPITFDVLRAANG